MYIQNPFRYVAGGYLFDTYSNALFGFGLMKLKTGQTLSCRVERDSDNAQTDIQLYDSGFIDMSSTVSAGGDLSTWIGSNSASIVTWYDQSGGGGDLTATATGIDLVVSGTLQTKDGLSVIKFNTKRLVGPGTLSELADGQDFSFFSVVAPTNSNGFRIIIATSDSSQSQCGMILDTRTQQRAGWALVITGTDALSNYSTRIITLNRFEHTMIVDGAGKKINTWKDGTAGGLDVSWTNTYINNLFRVNANANDFQAQLIVGFSENKSSERTSIESSINTLTGL